MRSNISVETDPPTTVALSALASSLSESALTHLFAHLTGKKKNKGNDLGLVQDEVFSRKNLFARLLIPWCQSRTRQLLTEFRPTLPSRVRSRRRGKHQRDMYTENKHTAAIDQTNGSDRTYAERHVIRPRPAQTICGALSQVSAILHEMEPAIPHHPAKHGAAFYCKYSHEHMLNSTTY